ncbi:alpha/beta hydrolase [Aquihabitans sp. McL0605]|uniref:alpha/beta hydrolase n=1 Tax=Aquihabitans sp. McL0605 TaxID=3415671 RepID=UPI003CF1D220
MGTMAKRMILAVAVLGLATASCSSGDGSDGSEKTTSTTAAKATSTTVKAIDWPEPVFKEGECPMRLGDAVIVDVTCGTVAVPENRLDPDSRMIQLAVATLHSTSPDPKPDPVVRLEGGPGFSSLADVGNDATSPVLDDRDYILWDQRGTGFSKPNLDCPEANEAIWESFRTTDDAPTEGARLQDSMRACRKRLVAEGVDLNGYNTVQNAADLADLRVALGIDEWNLRGVSYGSALAIETVRSHPEGLRSVLLDSIVPPDAGLGGVARGESALKSFDQLYRACADDAACAKKYGDLHVLFDKAAAILDKDPYETSVIDNQTGKERQVSLTGQDVWAGLFNAMYDNSLIPVLPGVAQAIVNGDNGVVDAIAESGIPLATDQTDGMTTSVDCADNQELFDASKVDPFLEEHPELSALVYLGLPETGCPEWDVESNPPPYNELLKKDDVKVPIIAMAGRFDPVTQVSGSQRVADALGVDLLLFPNVGHGAVGSDDCARTIWFAFMDDPSGYPDTSCMDDIEPITFG